MKKFLPLILIGSGLLIIIGVIFFLSKNSKKVTTVNEENLAIPELPASQRPVISLIPTNNPKDAKSDNGKMLDLKVQNINIPGAASMDYELVYTTGMGIQQGVPGTVKLDGTDIDRPLLLGSESSGKFRYDTGIETGTITFKFRNGSGKLIGKLQGDWHLQTGVTELTSVDGSFKYTLDKEAKGVYFLTMQTFAEPNINSVVISANGYTIFASDGKAHSGK
jgi:hypothetical protein